MGQLIRYVCDEGSINEVLVTGSGSAGWNFQPVSCANCKKVFQLVTRAEGAGEGPPEDSRKYETYLDEHFPYVKAAVCPTCSGALEPMSTNPGDDIQCPTCTGGIVGVVLEGTWE